MRERRKERDDSLRLGRRLLLRTQFFVALVLEPHICRLLLLLLVPLFYDGSLFLPCEWSPHTRLVCSFPLVLSLESTCPTVKNACVCFWP